MHLAQSFLCGSFLNKEEELFCNIEREGGRDEPSLTSPYMTFLSGGNYMPPAIEGCNAIKDYFSTLKCLIR